MICRCRVRSSSLNSSAIRATRCRSSPEICSREDSPPATLATTAFRKNRNICFAKCVGFCPSLSNRSTSLRTSSLDPCATCCITSSKTVEDTVPTNCRTASAVNRPSQDAMAWSRMESASRIEPSPASASRASASSSASSFSRPTRSLSCPTISSNFTARKLKC